MRALVKVCPLCSAHRDQPHESWHMLSQGLLRRFASLILILVCSRIAAGRAAGTPSHLVPPSPPTPSKTFLFLAISCYPYPQTPAQHSCPPPPSGIRSCLLPRGARAAYICHDYLCKKALTGKAKYYQPLSCMQSVLLLDLPVNALVER